MRASILALATLPLMGLAATASAQNTTTQQSTTTTTTDTAPAPASVTAQPSTAAPPVATTTTTGALSTASAPPGADLPAETETTSFVNRPLLVTGVVFLGGTYAASAIVGYTSSRDADQKNLYYPVAGPWMDLANRGCEGRPCSNETLNSGLLIADGVGQGLGALMMVTSFFVPEKTTRRWYLIGSDGVHVAPSHLARDAYGLSAMGTF